MATGTQSPVKTKTRWVAHPLGSDIGLRATLVCRVQNRPAVISQCEKPPVFLSLCTNLWVMQAACTRFHRPWMAMPRPAHPGKRLLLAWLVMALAWFGVSSSPPNRLSSPNQASSRLNLTHSSYPLLGLLSFCTRRRHNLAQLKRSTMGLQYRIMRFRLALHRVFFLLVHCLYDYWIRPSDSPKPPPRAPRP